MRKDRKYTALSLTLLLVLLVSGCTASSSTQTYTQEKVVSDDNMAQYAGFYAMSTPLLTIPGLAQEMIPQGMDYAASKGWVIISNYYRDKSASVLTIVDAETGEMVKAVKLADEQGRKHTSHVGGVAAGEANVWIASESKLFRISLDTLEQAAHMDTVRIEATIPIPTKGSYANVSNGILWVGEFYHSSGGYDTDATHHFASTDNMPHKALCVGYVLREDETAFTIVNGLAVPDYALSTIDRIQGLTQSEDGHFMLSQSYGRKNDATLYAYTPVLNEPAQGTFDVEGTAVPLWFLDGNTQVRKLMTAPMTEGICTMDDRLLVLYESGAPYYRKDGAVNPTDQVWSVSIPQLLSGN